jgi:hypothetical protein
VPATTVVDEQKRPTRCGKRRVLRKGKCVKKKPRRHGKKSGKSHG